MTKMDKIMMRRRKKSYIMMSKRNKRQRKEDNRKRLSIERFRVIKEIRVMNRLRKMGQVDCEKYKKM